MPMKTVHCSICDAPIRGSTFNARMTKLRRHYKRQHPAAWKRSTRKGVKARKETR